MKVNNNVDFVCPYCGHSYQDIWGVNPSSHVCFDYRNCGKAFIVCRTVSYQTWEPEENDI